MSSWLHVCMSARCTSARLHARIHACTHSSHYPHHPREHQQQRASAEPFRFASRWGQQSLFQARKKEQVRPRPLEVCCMALSGRRPVCSRPVCGIITPARILARTHRHQSTLKSTINHDSRINDINSNIIYYSPQSNKSIIIFIMVLLLLLLLYTTPPRPLARADSSQQNAEHSAERGRGLGPPGFEPG